MFKGFVQLIQCLCVAQMLRIQVHVVLNYTQLSNVFLFFNLFITLSLFYLINTNIFDCGVCENMQIKNLFVQLKMAYFHCIGEIRQNGKCLSNQLDN